MEGRTLEGKTLAGKTLADTNFGGGKHWRGKTIGRKSTYKLEDLEVRILQGLYVQGIRLPHGFAMVTLLLYYGSLIVWLCFAIVLL